MVEIFGVDFCLQRPTLYWVGYGIHPISRRDDAKEPVLYRLSTPWSPVPMISEELPALDHFAKCPYGARSQLMESGAATQKLLRLVVVVVVLVVVVVGGLLV